MTIVKNECSGCFEQYRLDTKALTLTMVVPSNGKRGKGHVPAHEVVAEVDYEHGGELLGWECPICGYADSEYVNDEMRRMWT
jgi:hypothetical protein